MEGTRRREGEGEGEGAWAFSAIGELTEEEAGAPD